MPTTKEERWFQIAKQIGALDSSIKSFRHEMDGLTERLARLEIKTSNGRSRTRDATFYSLAGVIGFMGSLILKMVGI